MKKSRRSQLLQHIAEITSIAIANKEYTGINTDAFTISLDLNLDRANVSRMLNDLWRENILIKIQGRPTFYLHRKTLLKRYPNSYIPALIPKMKSLPLIWSTRLYSLRKQRRKHLPVALGIPFGRVCIPSLRTSRSFSPIHRPCAPS